MTDRVDDRIAEIFEHRSTVNPLEGWTLFEMGAAVLGLLWGVWCTEQLGLADWHWLVDIGFPALSAYALGRVVLKLRTLF